MPEGKRIGPRLVAQVPPERAPERVDARIKNVWEDPDFFEKYAVAKPVVEKEELKLDFLISFHLDVHTGDTVYFFIYDQAKELTGIDFHASSGFRITSSGTPEFSEDRIFIRGTSKSRDYQVCTRSFDSERSANSYIQMLLLAFSELKAKLTGCRGGAIISEKGNYTF